MLTPQQIAKVVAEQLKDEYATIDIPPGVHTFSARLTLDVEGSVLKLHPQEYTPTAEIPLIAVLARFAEKAGVVGGRLLEMLTEAATEALDKGEPVGDYIEHTKEALRKVREKVTSKLPRKTRSGPTRRALKLEITHFVPIQQRETA
jgi:hypothetical protein